MKVEFWFDPACPFCWMTSRWLESIAPARDLRIQWRPISLKIKNGTPPDSPFFERVSFTLGLLRVTESMRAAGLSDRIGDAYTAFGTRIHHRGEASFDVAAVLAELGIDTSHADAMTDESFDVAIREAMADGLGMTGEDVGTPIIAVEGPDGRVALFGPVITVLPTGDAALRLWDGFVAMAETPGFFELKRTRTSAPDMSTIPLG